MGYVDYYLIVWDYINYAKSVGIPVGPGRGSGAGSILAYAIGITDIDPMKYNLLFERFLNPERISMPDFDVDFCYERRGEVIDYVERKYGKDHVSQIITFGTMSARMVIRDVGRALDMPYAECDKLAKMIPNELHITIKKAMEQNKELRDLYESDDEIHKMLDIAMALEGMPRQASTHACGIVITKEPVDTYVPLYVRDGQISTQFIMTTLEELGLLKMDFLGLRTLTVIQDAIDLVKENRGIDVEFDKDMNDPNVYKLWQNGESVGIFQFESQGMTNFMKELKPIKEGKVREIYDNGDSLIMVATDRISCFDVILNNEVTKKGTVLTQMSKFWFDLTEDILPNHMISVDVKDMPEFFRQDKFDGNSMLCRKLEMLPIECIVRGYITGSGWASYQENGTVCGIKLPEGLKESDKLPEPIYTPSTKAEIGDHDENISYEQSVTHLEKYFPGKGEEYAAKLRDYTIALYKKCAEYALSKGIIIADTKFEFGLDENGEVVIGDEMLTPDSSRFWPLEGYEAGKSQPSYDKQFVRDWLKANPDSDYLLPDDVIEKTVEKYKEAYKLLTGKDFSRK